VKDKKRWLVLLALIVSALALVAAGCGGDDDDGESASEPAAQTEEPAAADPAEAAGAGIKVALVTDTGGVNDRGFNENSIAGLDQAVEELGIEGRVYVSESEEDYIPNLLAAAEDGNDLVLSVGFLLTAQTIEIATAFPDVSFAGIDQGYGIEGDGCEESLTCVVPNALGLLYPSEESGYLAGIVAAMTTETGTISTVGGIKIPPVDNWIAGFQQGALSVNPDIKLLNAYSQDFVDQAKCKEIGIDQIAQGSDVVFQVAGLCGLGALDAAGDAGVFAVGVDADQSFKGDYVITSGLKPLAASVFGTIGSFVDGSFTGGENFIFSVVDFPDSVLLTDLSADVPAEAADAVAVATEQLISGEVDPSPSVEEVGATPVEPAG
jgi:basic membrane protein A